jgi:hypothetical protein
LEIAIVVVSGLIGILLGSFITSRILQSGQLQKIKLVAIEVRLKCHQEAYTCLLDIHKTLNNTLKRKELILNSQEWWESYCLYLDKKSRIRFKRLLIKIFEYEALGPKAKREADKYFMDTLKCLVKGMGLQWMGEDELGIVKKIKIE